MLGIGLSISVGAGGGAGTPEPLKTLVTETFLASGTFTRPPLGTFWSPSGVANDVQGETWAAGGGGTTDTGAGGGGGYSRGEFTPGATESVTVGTSAVNANGGNSSIGTAVGAEGGKSGTNGSAGGAAANGTGTTKFSGGAGGSGTGTRLGGGGAGDAADGSAQNGGASTGGVGSGSFGSLIGAGGGSTAAGQTAGVRGEVRVTYDKEAVAGFPRVRGRSFGRATADGTAHTVTMPSGIQAGERLVLLVACDGNPTITVSGWTKVGQVSDGTNVVTLALFHKVAAGGDTAQIDVTAAEQLSYEVIRVASGGVPEWTTATGSSTTPDPPAHTPSGGSAKYLWLAAFALDYNGLSNVTAFPASYGSFLTTPPALSTGALLGVAERFLEAASENPGTFTVGTEQWAAATISIPPA